MGKNLGLGDHRFLNSLTTELCIHIYNYTFIHMYIYNYVYIYICIYIPYNVECNKRLAQCVSLLRHDTLSKWLSKWEQNGANISPQVVPPFSREQIWDFPASFEDQKISKVSWVTSGVSWNLTCLAGKSTFLILSLHDLQLNVRVFPCLHKHKSPRRSTECLGMCLAHQPALRFFERTGHIAQKISFGLFNIANKYAWSCLVVEPNLQKDVN